MYPGAKKPRQTGDRVSAIGDVLGIVDRLHSATHHGGDSLEARWDHAAATRYRSQMVWFVNEDESGSQRIGMQCGREGDAFVLTVVDANGAETRTTFDDEDTMIAAAVRMHLGLVDRGWRAGPRTG